MSPVCQLAVSQLFRTDSVLPSRDVAELVASRAMALGYRLVSLVPYGRRGKWRLMLAYPVEVSA